MPGLEIFRVATIPSVFQNIIGILLLSYIFYTFLKSIFRGTDSNEIIHIKKRLEEQYVFLEERFSAANAERDTGGYVTLEIPENRKPLFHDLLKGFEDYASLKGYKISLSIDSSMMDEISFKITIDDIGVSRSNDSVKNDLDEYISSIGQ